MILFDTGISNIRRRHSQQRQRPRCCCIYVIVETIVPVLYLLIVLWSSDYFPTPAPAKVAAFEAILESAVDLANKDSVVSDDCGISDSTMPTILSSFVRIYGDINTCSAPTSSAGTDVTDRCFNNTSSAETDNNVIVHAQCILSLFDGQDKDRDHTNNDETFRQKDVCCQSIQDALNHFNTAEVAAAITTSIEQLINNCDATNNENGGIVSSYFPTNVTRNIWNSSIMIHSLLVQSQEWKTFRHSSSNHLLYQHYKENRNGMNQQQHNIDSNAVEGEVIPSLIIAQLSATTLSNNGGMHRNMNHVIDFQLNPANTNSSTNENPFEQIHHQYNVTLFMAFHLPSHLFINIEDCFEWDNIGSGNNSTALTSSSLLAVQIQGIHVVPLSSTSSSSSIIINQEEPEFVSPSHLVLFEIQVLLTLKSQHDRSMRGQQGYDVTTATSVSFSTKLHVRYPKPFPIDHDTAATKNAKYKNIVFVPPVLLTQSILRPISIPTDTCHHDCADRSNLRLMILQQMPQQQQQQSEVLHMLVAPGHQGHFLITITVTIVVTMVGSIIMLYDMISVTTWN